MSIKLIASILTGTLIPTAKNLLKSFLLSKMQKKLVSKSLIATGRPIAGVAKTPRRLAVEGGNDYVVTFNGALVQSCY